MAVSLLNLAWDTVSALYLHADRSEMKQWDDENQVTDEFWSAAQGPLGNAHALLHQGVELLLKARIAEVSPFLLLDRSVRDWPRDWTRRDTKYSEFRTIDAQDLIRLFDTVRPVRLDEGFARVIEEQRKTRNAFIHSFDKSLRHSPETIWVSILDICHHLIGPQRWITLRRAYLEGTPASIAWSSDEVPTELAWEGMHLLERLKPAQRALYLGMEPKSRIYICPHCTDECSDVNLVVKTAQLLPNKPAATEIFCFLCAKKHTVRRKDCIAEDCRGNVMFKGDGLICLTCFYDQRIALSKRRRAKAASK